MLVNDFYGHVPQLSYITRGCAWYERFARRQPLVTSMGVETDDHVGKQGKHACRALKKEAPSPKFGGRNWFPMFMSLSRSARLQ